MLGLVLLLVLCDLTDMEEQSADAKLGGLTESDVVMSVPKKNRDSGEGSYNLPYLLHRY